MEDASHRTWGMSNNATYAYAGKILRINLSNGRISTEPTAKYAGEWLGASGIAIKILYDELKSWVTPYEPANKIIFGAGALVGTTAPGASKMNVSTLGPMTGGWASSCSDSYVGGALKCAGYDSIVIEGRAHVPVYLWICDNVVEIRDASRLWGKNTWETLDLVRNELGDPTLHVLSIGPAGENLVRGACIIQDRCRAFGRCGQGAVMGSKNLKAIVAKGTGAIKVADQKLFMDRATSAREMLKRVKNVEIDNKYGTLAGFMAKRDFCFICYKNFQYGTIPDDLAEKINPENTIVKYEIARQSFPACGLGGCGRHLYVSEGPYAGLTTECNQWEVLESLQTRLAISEPTFMLQANALCDQLGLDVDMAGGTIGWAMECYQRGIIDEQDTDGLKLHWGDAGVALELIRRICHRKGFGHILAEGCKRAAELIGRDSSYYALSIKGQDLYEPLRGALGWCLGVITSTRGGGHTTGAVTCESAVDFDADKARVVYGVDNPDKPLEYDGKPKMIQYMEVLHRVNNCLGICHFNTTWWNVEQLDLPQMAGLYSAATGLNTCVEDLRRLAMRQLNLEKAFNLRHTDFDRKDDMPTPRDLAEPIPTGKMAGWKFQPKELHKMLDEYYELHGWDKETSFPTRKTLTDLGLSYVIDDLEKIGKIR